MKGRRSAYSKLGFSSLLCLVTAWSRLGISGLIGLWLGLALGL